MTEETTPDRPAGPPEAPDGNWWPITTASAAPPPTSPVYPAPGPELDGDTPASALGDPVETCQRCGGLGYEGDDVDKVCIRCEGTGRDPDPIDPDAEPASILDGGRPTGMPPRRSGTWPTSAADLLQPRNADGSVGPDPAEGGDVVEPLGTITADRLPPPRIPISLDQREVIRQVGRALRGETETRPPAPPAYTAWLSIYEGGAVEALDGEGDPAAAVNVTGSAYFVDRVVAAATDAFREDAER